ncbi:esterase [Aspergillus vadensis CBS 113365]|uniref:Carboxylic ester hydrolase n=1 Tax=Aspergillus vadensis (strain CBS 113365 / IMI 142717 / IBT 24658) TaxID=1448311 RepID=A0A319BY71_ASPVC|nr:esterase [Aspergillus vadensis CBS 113365]PYH70843.1 esterase [Aspergillus vadensis CBS 113365]
MPSVALDYCTVVAAVGNDSVGLYRYQNIRFAAPVTSDLRFAKPEWPPVETETNYGNIVSESIDCSTSEDYLFLDVWAPANSTGKKLPVLMYIYGGGFTGGSKIQSTPEGLFDLSKDFIYVAANYRLGVTGLANGPTFQHEGGAANAAVWDVTQALEWVQKYIGSFGGDPDAVTLSGFSAGASQVMFQLTRFSGRAPQLFKGAYIMSPGYVPGAGHHQAEAYWQNVSTAVGCPGGDITCMRSVNYTTLMTIGSEVASNYSYQLQPRVDGNIVADTYEAQLYQKNFNFSGPLVISHERHEENSQSSNTVTSAADIAAELQMYFPAITDDVIEEILELYPASHYANAGYRLSDIRQGFDMTGKNLALTQALHNETWNAIVNLGEATHGTDQTYYWYSTYSTVPANGLTSSSSSSVNVAVARTMQKYLLSFVLTGNPNTLWPNDKIYWPKYGNATNTINFNTTMSITFDDLANDKSLFWNKALWY